MHEPFKMIFVNLIGSLILLGGLFVYKYIYPKKKVNLFLLIFLISLLPTLSILRPGAYESGDFNIHIYRTIEFFRSLTEGNTIPSWAMNLNATYGYPLFTFNYTLPYYIISLFHFIGFSFIASLKVFLILNMILSAIFMYLFSSKLFKNTLAAFTSSVFYIFTPYHLISLHFKVTIGEILVFTLIPLLFWSLINLKEKKSIFYVVCSGLIFGLIFLSHIYLAIILIPVCLLLPLIFSSNKREYFIKIVISIFISILISSFQWLPSLIYKSYLFTSLHPVNINSLYYPSLIDLLYAPWRLGLLFQGPKGELSYLLGYPQLIILITFIFMLFRNKIDNKYRKNILLLLILIFSFILLVNPVSKELWNKIPLISSAGSHRLLILIGFFISILSGYFVLVNKNKKLLIYLIIFLAIGSTILNWGQRRVIPEIDDKILINNLPLTTASGEAHFYANSKWVNKDEPWFSVVPNKHIEILKGKGNVTDISRTSTKHVYKVNANEELLIKENTLYFPGWNVKANNKQINIFPDNSGVVNFYLPKGEHSVEMYYEDHYLLKLSKIISLSVILLSLIYIITFILKNYLPSSQRLR